ncbi:unnamed protein product [Lampetra fluviatilis]
MGCVAAVPGRLRAARARGSSRRDCVATRIPEFASGWIPPSSPLHVARVWHLSMERASEPCSPSEKLH